MVAAPAKGGAPTGAQWMKVAIVTSSFPFPADIGRKVVMAGFLDYFMNSCGGSEVTFICIASASDQGTWPLRCRYCHIELGGIGRRAIGVAWQSFIRRRRAVQEMLIYSRSAAALVDQLIRALNPDLVFVDTLRVAQYTEAHSLAPHSVLYLDDLYSLRYRRMLEAMRAHPLAQIDPLGSFARFVPAGVQHAIHIHAIQEALLRLESTLLERREQELPREYDRVLLLNEHEADHLRGQAAVANVSVVKPLLSPRATLPRRFSGTPHFVFLGNLKYPANAYSLSLFMTSVLPNLVAREQSIRLSVIGRGASPGLKALAARFDGHVEFLDFVDDLAPLLAQAAGMVVPLIYGSGLKLKVLDALHFGLPVVSTHKGVEGLPVQNGIDCLIEDDLSSFPERMLQLLDPSLNEQMSNAGQQLYVREFAPEVVRREYAGIFAMA
jgi:glycosyltransferase involved in cell wall biosynthesis